MRRRLSLFAALAALSVLSSRIAMADPVFTWSFDPATYTDGTSGALVVMATITNTGTSDIKMVTGEGIVYDQTIAPYFTSTATDFAALDAAIPGDDLAPGETTPAFIFTLISYANAPLGDYALFTSNTDLYVEDDSGAQTSEFASNSAMLDVTNGLPVATPEPSSVVLLGTGLAGALGLVRRRYLVR
jgi:hypothetical protein